MSLRGGHLLFLTTLAPGASAGEQSPGLGYFSSKVDCFAAKLQERRLATTSIYEMYGGEIPRVHAERILISDRLFNAFTNYRAKRIANHLSKFVNKDETILDCGCGSMRISEMLHKQSGVSAFGTDVIPLNQTDHHFCLCSGERLAFKDKSFDSVFLISTLHHMTNPMNALKESLRVAKKRLIVLEDIYQNRFELRMLKVLDWSGNILISKDMNFPFHFKTESEWKTIFESLDTKLVAAESVRPIPWRPSRHRMFVLDKNHS